MSYTQSIVMRFSSAVAIAAFALATAASLTAQTTGASSPAPSRALASYGKLPISFEVNQGQTDKTVQFLARGGGYTLFLTPGEAVLSLNASAAAAKRPDASVPRSVLAPSTVRMQLIGANSKAMAAGVDPLPGKSNYFIGSNPAKWHTDVPTYAKVCYRDVYPGVDLVYYGNQEGRLEHDFVVAPGADPGAIAMNMRESDGEVSKQNGGLVLRAKAGNLTMENPVAYQEVNGVRKSVSAAYVLSGNNQIRFEIGSYDKSEPLVIDPVIVYSSVFGGSEEDGPSSIAVDSSGNAYIVGSTYSTDFPVAHPYQSSWTSVSPNSSTAAFISKLNPSGTAFVYSTYLGGPFSGASQIKVDSAGRAYIVGSTGGGFPVKNAHQSSFGGGANDVFMTVLSPTGNSLVYSTYLGGSQDDLATGLALDSSNNAYITGFTFGSFPTTHSIDYKNGYGLFIAKFNSAGTLEYSTTYSNDLGESTAIAVDSTGAVYLTGYSNTQTGIPTTKGAFQTTCDYSQCGFVTKFSSSGASVLYATYLDFDTGGGFGIAVDSSAEAYVVGAAGKGLVVRSSGLQRTFGGGNSDAFVLKLNSSGSDLVWSTYLGGTGDDAAYGLALDSHRNAYVAGWSCSPNFPQKNSIQNFVGTSSHPCQFFVTTLNGSLSSIPYYSTYFGLATGSNVAISIAVDSQLNAYITGFDANANIPTTPGALKAGSPGNPGGGDDIFAAKLVIEDDLTLALSASPSPVGHGGTLTYTIAVTSKGPDFATNLRVTDVLPAGTTFVSDNAGGGSCTGPAVGQTGTLQCTLGQLNKGDTYTVKLTVHVNAAAGSTIQDTASTVSNTQDFVKSNNTGTVTTKVD